MGLDIRVTPKDFTQSLFVASNDPASRFWQYVRRTLFSTVRLVLYRRHGPSKVEVAKSVEVAKRHRCAQQESTSQKLS